METQTTVEQQQAAPITAADEYAIVKYVVEAFEKGHKARKKYEEDWEACAKAYDVTAEFEDDEELEWQSNHVLPWVYQAVESAHAKLHSTMLPEEDKAFYIKGENQPDHPGAEMMQQYLEKRLEKNNFAGEYSKMLRYILRKNHVCVKKYWKVDKQISYPLQHMGFQPHPETGEPVPIMARMPQENVLFNSVFYEVIPLENFSFYPIFGDFNKTTRIHETYRFLDELQAAAQAGDAPYFNLDKIKDTDETNPVISSIATYKTELAEKDERKEEQHGLNIKEAWIARAKINDVIYHNHIATIVNDKYLIRFEPNKSPMGESPFVWCPINPDEDCLYGYGLCSKGLPILRAANFIFNERLNEIKLKIHGALKYYEDGVFNPFNLIMRPGAMVAVADATSAATNLMPINPNLAAIQLAYSEVAELKNEFEETTVPKIVKGTIETEGQDATATANRFAQNNSAGKLNAVASQINQYLLKPLIHGFYADIYHKVQEGDQQVLEEIARVTQDLTQLIQVPGQDGQPAQMQVQRPIEEVIAQLPQILPPLETDIQVVGYQNAMKKEQQAYSLQQLVSSLLPTPGASALNWKNIPKMGARLSDLKETDVVLSDEDIQANQQAQQQAQDQQNQLLIMKEKAELDLKAQQLQKDMQDSQNKFSVEMARLQLDEQKFQFDAQMALRTADREDKQAAKEAEIMTDSTQVK